MTNPTNDLDAPLAAFADALHAQQHYDAVREYGACRDCTPIIDDPSDHHGAPPVEVDDPDHLLHAIDNPPFLLNP